MTKPLSHPPEIAAPFLNAPEQRESRSFNCDAIADPDPQWAAQNPEKFLTFLMVSPRSCAAVEALFSQ